MTRIADPPAQGIGTKAVRGISSDVVLDFRAHEAIKRYRRQPVIAFLYKLMFQAPFPYVSNHAALHAAKHRRLIAGYVTRYFLGRDVIAPVKRVEPVDGGYLFVTELIDGTEPKDHKKARAFLHQLADAFIATGLPTWQITPHNPRALGNLMETPDGDYRVIDLESNVVTPMVPVRELWGAALTAHLPPFDDIDLPRLDRFIEANWDTIVERLGPEDAEIFLESVGRYAWYENIWQKNEPRIWSRAIRRVASFLNVPGHLHGLARKAARAWKRGEVRAESWVETGVDRWQAEGIVSQQQAANAKADLQSGPVAATIGHLAAHFVISIPLRTPLGSIGRFAWTAAFRLRAEARWLLKRATPEETKTARGLHSVTVMAVGLIPGFGRAAYVFAAPLRKNRVVMSAALDQAFRLLPLRMYERFHLRAVTTDIAQHHGREGITLRQHISRIPQGVRSLWTEAAMLGLILGANAAALIGAGVYFYVTNSAKPFEQDGVVGILMVGEALVAGFAGILYYRAFWKRPDGEQRPGAAGTLFWLGGGLALVWLAVDYFFGIHTHVITALDSLPVVGRLGPLVHPAYLVAAIIFIRIFGYELESNDAIFALTTLAVFFAGVTVGAELLTNSASDWAAIVRGGQLATVACVLPAFFLKLRELRATEAT